MDDDYYGGIFDAHSVLGVPTSLGDDGQACVLSMWYKTSLATQLQQLLANKGIQGLTVDGLWGPCSETAFRKVFGVGTSAETIKAHTGVDCSSFKAYVEGGCANPPAYSAPSSTATGTGLRPQLQRMSPMYTAQATAPLRASQIVATSQQQAPPYTTPPVVADDGGANAQVPYVPPVPGQQLPGQQQEQSGTPWMRYGLIAGVFVAAGLGVWWWAKRSPTKPAATTTPAGRLRPIGTIE